VSRLGLWPFWLLALGIVGLAAWGQRAGAAHGGDSDAT
jgi:hypothetical protein